MNNILNLQTKDFDYELPTELIAQMPSDKREDCKMMILNRQTGHIDNLKFYQIVDLLDENDVLVLNNTKVIEARIFGIKRQGGAKIEVFLLKKYNNQDKFWECLIKPSKRVKVGTFIDVADGFFIDVIEKCEHEGKWITSKKLFINMVICHFHRTLKEK